MSQEFSVEDVYNAEEGPEWTEAWSDEEEEACFPDFDWESVTGSEYTD